MKNTIMKSPLSPLSRLRTCVQKGLLLALPILSASVAQAHLTYPSTRYFGTFTDGVGNTVTLVNQTAKAFGWADGTDADFAKQDDQRYFRFTLQTTTTITIAVTSLDASLFMPAFSIYAGVGHAVADPANPDYDTSAATVNYLATLGNPQPRKGAFDALHTFKIGNDTGALATLNYMGNAADGTAANYGAAAGINGDGVADGTVSRSFTLPAGDYTVAIGGANITSTDATARGFNVTANVVPEPTSLILLLAGPALLLRRRRADREPTPTV